MGSFLRGIAIIPCVMLLPTAPALALGPHKQKVYVPVTPVFAVPAVTQAPAPAYYYAPQMGVANAPTALAPTNGYYFTQPATSNAPMMLPAGTPYMYSPTGTSNAPQVSNAGTSFAPTTSSAALPAKMADSRITDEVRKDVLEDLKDFYRESKTTEKSRTALRKALKDQARELYVEVIGADVSSVDDLNKGENSEIDQIVDIVMRESSSSTPTGGSGTSNGTYGTNNGGQPYYFYYYAYPLFPVSKHGH
jgi:hypothetical protein